MKNGYWQKMLKVDLTNRKILTTEIKEDGLRSFVGGAGYGGEILHRQVKPKIDAYDPKNLVIFGTDPFQGPSVAGGAKFSIVGKSPITQTFADTAAGGDWGLALKGAGYDFLVVEGASDSPVYLHIVDDRVDIKDASHLWGMDSFETVDLIKSETKDKKLSVATDRPSWGKTSGHRLCCSR